MKRMLLAFTSLLVATSFPLAQAQQPSSAPGATSSPEPGPQSVFGPLPGRWVRLEGGYVISIKTVDAGGKLDASYANPSPLPFYSAVATRDGDTLKLYFELRAGGYGGSTYKLSYDPASDRLKGVYYQAVAKQEFEVAFARSKP